MQFRNWPFALLIFIMTAASSAFLANQSRTLYLNLTPPFEFGTVEVKPAVIASGDPLMVQYRYKRYRYCENDLNLFIVDLDNHSVVWRVRMPGGSTLLGEVDVTNKYQIPNLPAGHYSFNGMTYSQCSDGAHTTPSPNAPFTIRKN